MKILPTVDAALARAESVEQQRFLKELEAVNANGDSYDFLVAVRRSPTVSLSTKVRVARELLQYERPKLGVSVNISDDGTFAARLDAAIARSNGHPKLIEGPMRTIEGPMHSASELKEPSLGRPLRRRA